MRCQSFDLSSSPILVPAEPLKWAAPARPYPPLSSLLFHFATVFHRRLHISPTPSPFVLNNKLLLIPLAFRPFLCYSKAAETTTVITTIITMATVVAGVTPLIPTIQIQIQILIASFSFPCYALPPYVSSATSSRLNLQTPKPGLPLPTTSFRLNPFGKSEVASGPGLSLTPPKMSLSPQTRGCWRSYNPSSLHNLHPLCGSSAGTSSRD